MSDWYKVHPRGLLVSQNPSYPEWESIFTMPIWQALDLNGIHDATPFIIGDALNHGNHFFGELYSQAYNHFTGFKAQTLYNYKSVCGRVQFAVRNFDPSVTFSHHAAVARFWEDQDKQHYYLSLAADEYMTVAELRATIRDDHAPEEEAGSEFQNAVEKARSAIEKLYDYPLAADATEEVARIIRALRSLTDDRLIPTLESKEVAHA